VAPRSALPLRITCSDHPLGGGQRRPWQADWTCAAGDRVPVASGRIARCEVMPMTGQKALSPEPRSDASFRSSPWRRCSPFSPPSSRSSLSIVATPIVPDASRMTAPGLAENGPRCTSQFGGNRSLIGGLPLTPYRVAIPGTVPFRNRVASLGAVDLHLRVASNDADPFPQRTGSCDPVLPPGPFRSVPGR
jgi:hypothetical protein